MYNRAASASGRAQLARLPKPCCLDVCRRPTGTLPRGHPPLQRSESTGSTTHETGPPARLSQPAAAIRCSAHAGPCAVPLEPGWSTLATYQSICHDVLPPHQRVVWLPSPARTAQRSRCFVGVDVRSAVRAVHLRGTIATGHSGGRMSQYGCRVSWILCRGTNVMWCG